MVTMDSSRLLDGRLKVRHLILVITIADAGSIKMAAEVLHITQPVVTRGLKELEEILRVPLFDRLSRGVAPTSYGEIFIDHARAIVTQLRSAGQHVELLRTGELGSVAVGTHLAGSNLLLPRAIAALKESHPSVTVSVTEATPEDLQHQLLTGELDLLVGRLTPQPLARVQQEKLQDEPIRLVTRRGHPAHDGTTPNLRDLLVFPWIMPIAKTALRAELELAFYEQGVPLPENRVECTSILTLRHLLVSTNSVAALPMLIATEDEALQLLPTDLGSIQRHVGVTLNIDRTPSPATRVLLSALRREGKHLSQNRMGAHA